MSLTVLCRAQGSPLPDAKAAAGGARGGGGGGAVAIQLEGDASSVYEAPHYNRHSSFRTSSREIG